MAAQNETQTAFDVIVVGSGAGAMTAAVFAADYGLSVLVVEKSDRYGGTSAISGGGIWIPNNHHFAAIGGQDSREQALAYLKAATAGRVDESRLQAYVEHAPKMIEELERNSRVRYAVAAKYPDYYPHLPGALPGGRSLDPELFDTSVLGDELERMREPSPATLLMGKVSWTARQAHKVVAKEPGWVRTVLGLMARYHFDFRWRRRTRRDRRACLGGALIASLRRSLMDRDVPVWLKTEFRELVHEGGRVTGVRLRREGRDIVVPARRGVILASGGFEQNQALRDKYLPQPTKAAWSATPPGANTGAALEAGIAVGAATDLLDHGWWAPTIRVPGEEKPRAVFAERAFPGAIVVNGKGRRFVNEAAPYLEFVAAMYADNPASGGKSTPAWAIFDAHFRRHYAMGPLMPGKIVPDEHLDPAWAGSVYWMAETLDALAARIGIDGAGLKDTVRKFNEGAVAGKDAEFGRGDNAYDRYYGDTQVKPNPCLAPLTQGPFYAMRIDAGDIGTKGGLLTNAEAQVLLRDGSPIPGLYAIGNCSAAVMGPSYPGAGGTLGPAMTFGYLAARHLAGAR